MPRHRQVLWASLSAVAMASWAVSMAWAQDPAPRGAQEQGTSGQDPFDAAEKGASGRAGKGTAGAAGKAADKKAEKAPEPEFVRKSLLQWQRSLPRGVFEVTRLKATEPPFSGRYAIGHFNGTFVCACCDAELFSSRTKFESGTGWPSFWQPIKGAAVDRALDNNEAEPRIEVMCHRCGAHLGHVFDDGPPPTGLRFCINSLSLKLKAPEGEAGKSASTKARAKSKGKTTRTRSRGATRSSGTRGTGKAAEAAPVDGAQAGSDAPAAGKSDGSGR